MDLDTLRAMAKMMQEESDEPGDIRGLRARAVLWAVAEIERLTANAKIVSRGELDRGKAAVRAYVDAKGYGSYISDEICEEIAFAVLDAAMKR